jgi:hypothetical protein
MHIKTKFLLKIIAWCMLLSTCYTLQAQDPLNPDIGYLKDISKGRKILSQFTFGLSSGYQWNIYDWESENYTVGKFNDQAVLGQGWPAQNINRAYTHWLSNPTGPMNLGPGQMQEVFNADSLANQWRGVGRSIPIQLTLFYTIADQLRIGVGIQQEFGQLPSSLKQKGGERVGYPESNINTQRAFALLGVKIFDYRRFTLANEFQIGGIRYRNPEIVDSVMVADRNLSLGMLLEYNFSEFSHAFFKFSSETRTYTLRHQNLPEPIKVNNPVYGIQVGLRMRVPDVKRCPISSCKVRYRHGHGGYEFRGSSIFRKQNLKYGEGYGKRDIQQR